MTVDGGMTREWRAFYSGRRVLVTGHTGFKGSWLVAWLRMLGAEVCGIALPPEQTPHLHGVLGHESAIKSISIDIRDAGALQSAVTAFRPEVVFHLAAQSLVKRGYDDPIGTVATNVLGTIHILEAARRAGSVRAMVNVTSDKCYQNQEWSWPYRENDPLGGADPYSASKGAAELLSAAYRQSFFSGPNAVAMATVRAGNVIGGGDWAADRLAPDIARAASSGQPVRLRRPDAVRPWQYVLEPLRGYLLLGYLLARHGSAFAEAWNFGPNAEGIVPVRDLTDLFLAQWYGRDPIANTVARVSPEMHETTALRLDISKARDRLRWEPVLSLLDGIRLTVAWYRAYYARQEDMRLVTVRQIDEYTARLQ